MREICAPVTTFRIIQRKLNYVFKSIYSPKPCVQGFTNGKSIVTNARAHRRRYWVFNLDLKTFFPSIHFGRVRGLFLAPPYNRNEEVATALAQICCFNKSLPEGAPTSPIVSNMICSRLDGELIRLASARKCLYTRYADDITISTSQKIFPPEIAILNKSAGTTKVLIGDALKRIIEGNKFEINLEKCRFNICYGRQTVTGLVVNRFPNVKRKYVRQIRAMLHAWKAHGYAKAEHEYHSRYLRNRNPLSSPPSFRLVLKGKIEFVGSVKGKGDFVYKKFLQQLHYLDPSLVRTDQLSGALGDVQNIDLVRKALWVIESDVTQGTGFLLNGYGLITCAHVLGPNAFAFQPNSAKKYDFTIAAIDQDLDLAILRLGIFEPPMHALTKGVSQQAKDGDKVTIHGFPNFQHGDDGFVFSGHVSGRRVMLKPGTKLHDTRRIMINAPIIAGNSGGPVLDGNDRVIGVAVTGGDHWDETRRTEKNGVVPIELLDKLLS